MRYLLLVSWLLVATSCTRAGWEAAATSPIDTTVRHQVASQLQARNIKFNGPVTLQVGGTGNTGTATDATKAKAPVAAAPHATIAEADPKPATVKWKVALLLAFTGLLIGAWIGSRLSSFAVVSKSKHWLANLLFNNS